MSDESAATMIPITQGTGDERPRKVGCVTDELLPDGGMVLYHTCQQKLLTLNPTAALIWECCDGAHDIAAIAGELRDVFPDAGNIEADVLRILQTLLEGGMLIDDAM